MGVEEGDGAGEGAAGAEAGHVVEGEPLQLLVLLQREVLAPGLELCGLRITKKIIIKKIKKKLKQHTLECFTEHFSKVQLLRCG